MGKSGIIMKLRTKLKLAFCTMIVLPVLMCGCAIMGIIKYQNTAMQKLYGVDEAVSFDNMYSSSVLSVKLLIRYLTMLNRWEWRIRRNSQI